MPHGHLKLNKNSLSFSPNLFLHNLPHLSKWQFHPTRCSSQNPGVILDFSFFHTPYTQSTSKSCCPYKTSPEFHHSQQCPLQPPLSEPPSSRCRSFLIGHPALLRDPLQTKFYAADGVILFQHYSDVTHLLKTLPWLPFPLRIKAKFLHLRRWMSK